MLQVPFMSRITLCLVCALLAACANTGGLKPHARLLQAPITDQSATSIAWPRGNWWRQYGDAQLDALVARAVADSPDIQLAQGRVARAQALAGLARSGLQPEIDANGSFQRMRFTEQQFIPPPFAGSVYWNNAATLDLSYDLDLWGQRQNRYLAMLNRAQAASLDSREATLALQTGIVRSYVKLSEAYALRSIASANLQREQQILDISRQLYAAGLGTRLAVSEAVTALPDTRAQIEALNARIIVLEHQLAALSGQPPAAGETLSPPRLALDDAAAIPQALPANLLGHRPDIVAQRLRVEATRHAISAAKASFYPNINLTAFAGFQALSFSRLFTGSAAQYGAGPAISLPIFEGGRLRSGLKGADADYDMAVAAYNATLLHALQGTADDIAQLHSLQRQSRQIDIALHAARHAYDQARRGYAAGLTNELNVLQTQSSLLEQQRNRARLDAQRLDRYAQLMQSLGGGFSEAAAVASAQPSTPTQP